ncbi:MAG: phosphomannomutase/phosphoglucomutase [Cellvibrio sp.]
MDKPDKLPEIKKVDNSTASSRAAQRAQEAARRTAAARQKVLLIGLGIAIAVNALLAYLLYGALVVDVQRQRQAEMTESQTRAHVEAVRNYLTKVNRQFEQAMAYPDLTTPLTGDDREQLLRWQERLEEFFDNPIAVRLIPAGTAKLNRNGEAPIRFAELDLIRRAERREPTLPEAAVIEDKWLLHLIAPVPADTQQSVAGTLMVSLDGQDLFKAFSVGDASLGQATLLQKIAGSSPLTVVSRGNGTVSPAKEIAIPGSYWSVRFVPSQQLVKQSEELPTLWLLVLSVTSIAGLVLAWIASKVLVKAQTPQKASTKADTAESAIVEKASETAKATEEILANPIYQSQDILDIAVIEEDDDILGLNQATGKKASSEAVVETLDVPAHIFRSYDIRGVVDQDLTLELAEYIGAALGSEVLDQGETSVLVARDGRLHSEALSQAMINGILGTGCHVIDIGVVPTPVLYFATFHLPDTNSGVMVTASHNPAEYNGFKMVINGVTLADDAVMGIRSRIMRQQFHRGQGNTEYRDVVADYIDRIFSDVALASNVSLVIDAGNAVTGVVAPRLFEELGCDVTQLYCELDGSFPNHDPDPCHEKNLRDLIAKVQEVGADLGVAFDGDGDRLVVVTPKGRIIWPDHLLMLFARDVLARNPGADVLFDVKCSRQLNQVISSYGGRPLMWKTGHSPMKAKMIETGALIGGEYSGHIFIKDRWYGFDDGMYAMARLLEIITLRDQKIDDVFEAFPILPATPELKIAVPDADKAALIQQLIEQGDFQSGKPTTIDGLRVDFAKGWGLVRPSNTSAALTLRFEAETEEILEKIKRLFKRELLKIKPDLNIEF